MMAGVSPPSPREQPNKPKVQMADDNGNANSGGSIVAPSDTFGFWWLLSVWCEQNSMHYSILFYKIFSSSFLKAPCPELENIL